MHTVGSVIETIYARFGEADLVYGHGTDNPWDEATALVVGLMGCADDQASLHEPVDPALLSQIDELASARISSRQPLAYLLGHATYMGLEFAVQSGVVIPRSPLGFLLPDDIAPWQRAPVSRVLDLCAGSGCLGIVAAHIYADAQVELYELDPLARTVAQQNIIAHGVAERVAVVAGDVTQVDLPKADLVLFNPPYVNALDMRTLPPEYRHEPVAGLAAGQDGLAVLLPVLDRVADFLNPGGVLLGEVGASAAALIRKRPELPFVWLDLPHGGEGVFLLEGDAMSSHTARQQSHG